MRKLLRVSIGSSVNWKNYICGQFDHERLEIYGNIDIKDKIMEKKIDKIGFSFALCYMVL